MVSSVLDLGACHDVLKTSSGGSQIDCTVEKDDPMLQRENRLMALFCPTGLFMPPKSMFF